jgi:TolB protein
MYGFEDPVDVDAWRKLGAEAIVKVAARKVGADQIQVFGLAYLMSNGKKPVFEKNLTVKKTEARVTAHRITDALLGALTGRPGGFASELAFSGRWGKNRRIFRMDADGNGLLPFSEAKDTAIAPAFGPGNKIFYLVSHDYSPFTLGLLAVLFGHVFEPKERSRGRALQDVDVRGFDQPRRQAAGSGGG